MSVSRPTLCPSCCYFTMTLTHVNWRYVVIHGVEQSADDRNVYQSKSPQQKGQNPLYWRFCKMNNSLVSSRIGSAIQDHIKWFIFFLTQPYAFSTVQISGGRIFCELHTFWVEKYLLNQIIPFIHITVYSKNVKHLVITNIIEVQSGSRPISNFPFRFSAVKSKRYHPTLDPKIHLNYSSEHLPKICFSPAVFLVCYTFPFPG
jgi:hypothetical protein